jgi:hypothetical protein
LKRLKGRKQVADRLIREMLEAEKKEIEELRITNPEPAIRMELEIQGKNAQMVSNIMSIRHETLMTVARNFR